MSGARLLLTAAAACCDSDSGRRNSTYRMHSSPITEETSEAESGFSTPPIAGPIRMPNDRDAKTAPNPDALHKVCGFQ